ncbi:hypothetical protein ACFLYB_05710 [Chloroflexota bacterium]
MQLNWQKVYSELTDFIHEHPEIKIGISVIRIPGEYSSRFYSLHAKTRAVFIEDNMPDLLEKSQTLSKHYIEAEEEVTKLIGLQDISTAPSLNNFLHNPIDQLAKEIYTPLLNLLKGQIDMEKYETVALNSIRTAFKSLYSSGYEKWVMLSLVRLLKADKAFKVIPEEVTEDDTMRHGGKLEYRIPPPEESTGISFRRDVEVGFMVPDFIIHSAEADRYFSFTSEIIQALAAATNPSKKREWLPGDPAVVFEGDIILVNFDDNLVNLSLVTDCSRTCLADLIIECRVQKDWYEKEGSGRIKAHYDKYKPRLGTYILTLEDVPEQIRTKLALETVLTETTSGQSPDNDSDPEIVKDSPQVQLLKVGFDQTRLKPIVDILSSD